VVFEFCSSFITFGFSCLTGSFSGEHSVLQTRQPAQQIGSAEEGHWWLGSSEKSVCLEKCNVCFLSSPITFETCYAWNCNCFGSIRKPITFSWWN